VAVSAALVAALPRVSCAPKGGGQPASSTRLYRGRLPWFNLNAMSPADLRPIYKYVRRLGRSGRAGAAAVRTVPRPT